MAKKVKKVKRMSSEAKRLVNEFKEKQPIKGIRRTDQEMRALKKVERLAKFNDLTAIRGIIKTLPNTAKKTKLPLAKVKNALHEAAIAIKNCIKELERFKR